MVFQKLTGWSKDNVLQKYTHIFSEDLATAGEMRFLGGKDGKDYHSSYMVDISKKDGKLVLSYYPHTDITVIPDAGTDEEKSLRFALEHMYNVLYEKYEKKRDAFTIDLYNMCELAKEDFKKSFPGLEAERQKVSLFIFETEDKTKAFPRVFVLEKRDSDDANKMVPPLLPIASRVLSVPTGKRTPEGKYFSFLLLNSQHKGKFQESAPNLASVEFPTSSSTRVANFYQTERFEKMLDTPALNSLKVKDGKIVDEKEDEEVPAFIMGEYVDTSDMERIIRGIVDKNEIKLSDILITGAFESLRFFPKNPKAVNVNMDIGGYAAKMCVFEGFYYAIPKEDPESKEALLTEFGDSLVICDSEMYPAISQ